MWRKILNLALLLGVTFLTFGLARAESEQSSEVISLEKAMILAMQNSTQLKIATVNMAVSKMKLKEANAAFMPNLDYQFGYNRSSEGQWSLNPNFNLANPSSIMVKGSPDQYLGKISLSQKIFTGGRLTATQRLAEINLELSELEWLKAKQQLTYQVKEAYYRLWLAEQMFLVSKNSNQNMSKHLEQVKKFYQIGTVSKFEVLRAQVQLEGLKPQLIKAENGVKLTKLNLATLIGFKKTDPFVISNESAKSVLGNNSFALDGLLDEAYQKRPEMQQNQKLLEISQMKTKLAQAGYKPNVLLVGSYQGLGDDFSLGEWKQIWMLGVNISGNLFNGGATTAQVSGSKEEQALVELRKNGLQDQIHLELEQTLQGIDEAEEMTKANQAQLELAKEALRLTKGRFEAGMATTLEIMDAQLAYDQAASGYYQGLAGELIALAKLELVMGSVE